MNKNAQIDYMTLLDDVNQNIQNAFDPLTILLVQKVGQIQSEYSNNIKLNEYNLELEKQIKVKEKILSQRKEMLNLLHTILHTKSKDSRNNFIKLLISLSNQNKKLDKEIDKAFNKEKLITLKESIIDKLLKNENKITNTAEAVKDKRGMKLKNRVKKNSLRNKYIPTVSIKFNNEKYRLNNRININLLTEVESKTKTIAGTLLTKKNNESRNSSMTQYSKTIIPMNVNKTVQQTSQALLGKINRSNNNILTIINNIITRSENRLIFIAIDKTKHIKNQYQYKHFITKDIDKSGKSRNHNQLASNEQMQKSNDIINTKSHLNSTSLIKSIHLAHSVNKDILPTNESNNAKKVTHIITKETDCSKDKANNLIEGLNMNQSSSITTNFYTQLNKTKAKQDEAFDKLTKDDNDKNILKLSVSSPSLLRKPVDSIQINNQANKKNEEDNMMVNITHEQISSKCKLLIKKLNKDEINNNNDNSVQSCLKSHIDNNKEINALLLMFNGGECNLNYSNSNTVNQNKELIFNQHSEQEWSCDNVITDEDYEKENKKTLLKQKLEELLKKQKEEQMNEKDCNDDHQIAENSIEVIVEQNENEGDRYDTMPLANDYENSVNNSSKVIKTIDKVKEDYNDGDSQSVNLENIDENNKNSIKSKRELIKDKIVKEIPNSILLINNNNKEKQIEYNYNQTMMTIKESFKKEFLNYKTFSKSVPNAKIKFRKSMDLDLVNYDLIKLKTPKALSNTNKMKAFIDEKINDCAKPLIVKKENKQKQKLQLKQITGKVNNYFSKPSIEYNLNKDELLCQTERIIRTKPYTKRQTKGVIDFSIEIKHLNQTTTQSNNNINQSSISLNPIISRISKTKITPSITCEDTLTVESLMSKKARDKNSKFSLGMKAYGCNNVPLLHQPNEAKTTLAKPINFTLNINEQPKSKYRKELDDILIKLDNLTTRHNQRINNPLESMIQQKTIKYVSLINLPDEIKKKIFIDNKETPIEESDCLSKSKTTKSKPSLQIDVLDNHYIINRPNINENSSEHKESTSSQEEDIKKLNKKINKDKQSLHFNNRFKFNLAFLPLKIKSLNEYYSKSIESKSDFEQNKVHSNLENALNLSNTESINYSSLSFDYNKKHLINNQKDHKQAKIKSHYYQRYYHTDNYNTNELK